MQAVGIIAEYNPFHNGHQWQVAKAKELSRCPYAIAVMSGHFVQRGEPAIIDKWQRAAMAVSAGVDLVIELPVVFAVRSAQYFAAGGIRLLHSLGIVSHVCFGAEYADLSALTKVAGVMQQEQTLQDLRYNLKTGQSYAAALGKALQKHAGINIDFVASPNNILAFEYLRAIKQFAPTLVPVPVQRQYAPYHANRLTTPFASATAIRQTVLTYKEEKDLMALLTGVMPPSSVHILLDKLQQGCGPVTFDRFSAILLHTIRTMPLDQLQQLPDVAEGLHYKIKEAALRATSVSELTGLIKSRRYSFSRIQRILMHALLGTTQAQLISCDQTGPLYIRVLAFNRNGRNLLKHITSKAVLPVIIKTTGFLNSKQRNSTLDLSPLQSMLALDTLASDSYVFGFPNPDWHTGGWDFLHSPVYIPSTPIST
ncbi:high nucleotidyl transferase [Lucifera butyrica]|uniref:tRNA(Met) cytidine acetate ligase n=1 Tax=Lucifera butyrica TaxID=1351585 RepID=A0A498R4B0_9FIRM|nr:nucleotidyltransferase [Lucifera butyrica]VBB05667.1 high nucleotidyl transferase [Lucifera butyrica]